MKKVTEKNTPVLPHKVYQPPVIVSLGEMLKGRGHACVTGPGEDAVSDCPAGNSDILYCFVGVGGAAL